MSHIFISYSRRDIDFAQKIVTALVANNLDTWIDWKSIPKGEKWLEEIYRGIEGADAFLFLISPDSVISDNCSKEIEHAVKNNKRIIPVVVRDADSKAIPGVVSERNWIFCRYEQGKPDITIDNFGAAIEDIQKTIHTDYDWLKYHTELQVKALKWEQNKDTSRLLRGKELREAEQQLAQISSLDDPQPTQLQREFVLTSRKNEERLRQQTIYALVVGLAIMVGLAIIAWEQRNNAIEQAQISLSRQLAAQALSHVETDYDLALLLAVAGSQIDANSEVQASLVSVLEAKPQLVTYWRGPTDHIPDIAFSPDGSFLFSTDPNRQSIFSLDVYAGKSLNELPPSQMDEASNLLWDVQAQTILRKLHAEENEVVESLTLNPDGTLLAESSSLGEIVFWDARTGLQSGKIVDDQRYSIMALAFSPDGRLLASGNSNGTIRLWDVQTLRTFGEPMLAHLGWIGDLVTDVAFGPDGTKLFSSGCAQEPTRGICPLGEILVWDVQTQELVTRLNGHVARIKSIALHPDGKRLASVADDSTIILWDLMHRAFLGSRLEGHSLSVNDLTFSPDGKTLVSASSDGTLGLWDVTGNGSNRMLTVLNDGNVMSVAFNPDGSLLASGDTDGNVRLWDGTSYAPSAELREKNTSSVGTVEFSPDGTLMASGHYDGQVLLWNVPTRKLTGELLPEASGKMDLVKNLAFSPDSKLLISASSGEGFQAPVGARGHIFIWDVQTQKKIGEVRDPGNGSAYSLAFSPAGGYFAIGYLDGRIQLVEIKTLQMFREWQAHVLTTSALAFNRDGTLLASSGLDKTISLWDTRSWELVGSMVDHTGEVRAVAFAPTGDRFASAGTDQVVRVWDVGLTRWQELACEIAARNLTHAEWKRYTSSDIPYRAICPSLPIPEE